MHKNTKQKTVVSQNNKIWALVCGSLIVVLLFTLKTCNGYKQKSEDAGNYITSSKDTLLYLKDSLVAQRKASQMDADLFKTILSERDDLKKALKDAEIKAKNVHSFTSVVSHNTITPGHDSIIVKIDSIPCPDFGPIPFSAKDP